MRLLYFTALNYPSVNANNQQVAAMADAFADSLGDDFAWIANSSRSADEFADDGPKPTLINCRWKHLRSVYNAWWFVTHIGKLKEGKTDAVVYCKDPQLALVAVLFKRIFKYRVVFESHLLFSPFFVFFIFRWADGVVALTSHLKNDIVSRHGYPAEKILVAPDAVNLELFDANISVSDARKKLGLPADRKIALYCGSLYLHQWKGVDVLCRAAELLPDEYLTVFVGARDEEEKKRVGKGSRDTVMVVERQPHEKIPLYLKAADVLVLPNARGNANSEKYTSPLKLFEYMAAGRPIVASDLPSIREILSEQNSFLVKPGKPDELAEAIQRAAGNDDRARRNTERARRDVERLTWKNRANTVITFIAATHGFV